MSTAKCHGAVATALQAAPSLLASVDSQSVLRQRVPPATIARDMLSPDFAAIDIGEVDNRRTISTNHAPATICHGLHPYAPGCNVDRPPLLIGRSKSPPFHVLPLATLDPKRELPPA
jgi:hypothetical protein